MISKGWQWRWISWTAHCMHCTSTGLPTAVADSQDTGQLFQLHMRGMLLCAELHSSTSHRHHIILVQAFDRTYRASQVLAVVHSNPSACADATLQISPLAPATQFVRTVFRKV